MTHPLQVDLSKAAMQPRTTERAPSGARNAPSGPGGHPRLGQGVLSRVMANRVVQPPKPKLAKPGAPSIAKPEAPAKPKTAMGISKSRLMSDAEIRRRKKIQSYSSEATGALGLTALGGTLLATKSGGRAAKKAFNLVGRKRPGYLKPKRLKKTVAPLLATSAGIGGASAFNFAAYTKAESRKKKPVIKMADPFNIEKIGFGAKFEAGLVRGAGRGRSRHSIKAGEYGSRYANKSGKYEAHPMRVLNHSARGLAAKKDPAYSLGLGTGTLQRVGAKGLKRSKKYKKAVVGGAVGGGTVAVADRKLKKPS